MADHSNSGANGLTALVIDDDPLIREVVADMLDTLGYAVREASGGEAAIIAIARAGIADLFLIDLRMPDLSGAELQELIAKDFADIRVIFMTGHPDELPASKAPVLAKPFTFNDLAAAVNLVTRPPAESPAA